jgi:hypothetical protein
MFVEDLSGFGKYSILIFKRVHHETSLTPNNEKIFNRIEAPLSLLRRGVGGEVSIGEAFIFIAEDL